MTEETITTSVISTRSFMQGDPAERMTGRGNHTGGSPYNDYARAMRELRYLNAIVKHGPRVKHIADAVGVRSTDILSWLIDATHRHPQIWEDDDGRIYLGRYGKGEKEYARYYDV